MTIFRRHPGLDASLREAYRAREDLDPGNQWQLRIMAGIREIGPLGPSVRFLPLFEQFVWRLVPAVSLLALVLVALMATIDVTAWGHPLQVLLNGAEESVLTQIFGA